MQLRDAIAACAGDDRPAHRYLTTRGEAAEVLTRAALFRRVTGQAAGLAAHGVRAGDRVALVADDVAGFTSAFLAAIRLGAVPVPLPPPPAMGRPTAWLEELRDRLQLARPHLVCASAPTATHLAGTGVAVAYPALGGDRAEVEPADRRPNSPVYLQFTSGSTGVPRAVVVTGESLAANCAAITAGLGLTGKDVGVSWLPLHHDMGLVGFVCAALTAAVPVVLLPTLGFVRDPALWMRTVSTYRGTVTFGPSFAFGLAARKSTPADRNQLDLASVRILGCGGEPIRPDAVRRFLDLHRAAGLDPAAFTPSYGLAESTLAVSFGRGLATDGDTVDCGPALPGHELSIRDDAGRPLPPAHPGEIWARGPSIAAGYLDQPDQPDQPDHPDQPDQPDQPDDLDRAMFRPDGWLRTGDRGYLHDGRLHVTGRDKDVLIIRGVNLDPQQVEWAVGDLPGIQEGGVVAFTRPGPDTEELVVAAECLPSAPPDLADRVRAALTRKLGLAVSDLVRVPPRTLPKTTSGKPRRQEARRQYLSGDLSDDLAAEQSSDLSGDPADGLER